MENKTLAHFIHKFFYALFILLIFLSSGCSSSDNNDDLAQSLTIDPVFQEYYNSLGGKQVLGEVISPAFVIQDIKYQYTVGALFENDLLSEGGNRVKLSSIGKDLNIDERIEFVEGQISGPFLRDFIYPEFLQVYQYLGGIQVVGKPLTGLHYNPEFQRYEQYFENLGFYRLEKDTPGTVYLLAYGAWKCGKKCPTRQKMEATVLVQNNVDPIFVSAVQHFGYGFTGFALSEGYQADDGAYEQIFENVLLRVDRNQSGQITLAPLTQKLGIASEPFEPPAEDAAYKFIPVNGQSGYNVPLEFLAYMDIHGGLDGVGNPIGKLGLTKNGLYQQCFVNMCLEMDKNITGIYRVRPAPLGYSYLKKLGMDLDVTDVQPTSELPKITTPPVIQENAITQEISLQVWENNPFVTSEQKQVIGVMVYGNNQPLANMTPELVITLPDGNQKEYFMPATDENGKSQIQLEPTGASNGTLIPYQVCVSKTIQDKFCVQDNFLIWNNP
ncbi:MAG: hypothetical protein JW908_05780 [Anaerolineales bacterium]|nr:hypothetical protein [Anaerolineales bacterium]